MSSQAIATRFAAALDRCDFAEAARYLAADCCYQIGQDVLIGPEAIIASYRESDEWGRGVLEQVVYRSRVEQSSDHVTITYIDQLFHHGETHEYRCQQHLWLDASGRIAQIVHEELPGEREKLDEFFARVGVKR